MKKFYLKFLIANIFKESKAAGIYTFIIISLLTNIAFIQNTYAQAKGPGAAWQYVRLVSLSTATPLASFQVKVTLSAGQYTNMNTNGNDLRFYDVNNNACNYWIELWNTSGTSTIWVNVPSSGSNTLYMYYGNTAAGAVSNGNTTFDFFDDFTGTALNANWTTITTNGTVAVSTGNATITNTNGGNNTGGAGIYTAFTPQSTAFIIEAKHREGSYYRNRFYALDASNPSGNGGSNTVLNNIDYGFFVNGTPQIFWNAYVGNNVSVNTDYLSRWDIADGTNTTYTWSNYLYSSGAQLSTNSTTISKTIRYLSFRVTEQSGTSTSVDWTRVRKAGATEPLGTAGSQLAISATITAQTNVLCNGQSSGSATVTPAGGLAPYTYSWNSSPVQTTPTATNIAEGTYTVTVTDNTGFSTTATATITFQPVVTVLASNPTNITCNAADDGTITISASGGTGPYSYSVDNVHDINNLIWVTPSPAANPYVYGGLQPGVAYRIRVKDGNGCISK